MERAMRKSIDDILEMVAFLVFAAFLMFLLIGM